VLVLKGAKVFFYNLGIPDHFLQLKTILSDSLAFSRLRWLLAFALRA